MKKYGKTDNKKSVTFLKKIGRARKVIG